MYEKFLIIVDPQNDFIEGGSLPVSGARSAMQQLAEFVKSKSAEFSTIFVTQDSHPENHCSFSSNGGIWPVHCVRDSSGFEVFPQLQEVLSGLSNVEYCRKGMDSGVEQYSIFSYSDGEITNPDGKKIISVLAKSSSPQIVVCGIAGDVCVLNTLNDLVKIRKTADDIAVAQNFTASIDGGEKLEAFCKDNNINLLNL
ncbi:MAG: isochorismatase family protein [Bacteroidaceae bacterium]|nr:isochorismatase family protein [Bacteroidaceae bacterium]